jgi:hypothetical protein
VSQGNSVTVDVSTGSKCHSGRNVGGRNVKAPPKLSVLDPARLQLCSYLFARSLLEIST